YVVTSTADDAGSTCEADAACTLRQAITAANASGVPSTVDFDIAGSGVHTIQPQSELPDITGTTTIDGTSQPGFSGCANGPVIELDGTNVVGAGSRDGLVITGDDSTIRGLTINRFSFPGRGILVQGGGGGTMECNWIGTNNTGTAAAGNWVGISVFSPGNTIGGVGAAATRNVISGNGESGIRLQAPNTVIEGNYIGTDAAGQHALG